MAWDPMNSTSSTVGGGGLPKIGNKTLNGQSIIGGHQRHKFNKMLLTGNVKGIYNEAVLDTIYMYTVENFNKVFMEMTKYTFLAYAFHKQKRYICGHLIKPRSMQL